MMNLIFYMLSTLPSIFFVFARSTSRRRKEYVQYSQATKIILIYCQLDVVLLLLLKKKHLED